MNTNPQERRFAELVAYLQAHPPAPLLLLVLVRTLEAAVDVVIVTESQRRGDDAPAA